MKQSKYVLSMMLTVTGACGDSAPCVDGGFGENVCAAEGAAPAETGIDPSADATSGADDSGSGGGPTLGESTASSTSPGPNGTQEGGSVVVDDSGDDSGDDPGEESGVDTAGSSSAGSDEDSESSSSGVGVSPTPFCDDDDGDGYGDPADCTAEQGPTDVDNNDDCDDDDPLVHPGSAEHEADLTLCTADQDQDGYADASPPPGVAAGTDCWDSNAQLNPAGVVVASIDNTLLDDLLVRVDLADGGLALVGIFDTLLVPWQVTSTTINVDGTLYANDSVGDRIYTLTHELLCLGELSLIDVDPLPQSHGLDEVCGITFMGDGRMFAVDAESNTLVQLDPETGAVLSSAVIEYEESGPMDIDGCGVAWDCAEDRLLLANGIDGNVYEIDVGSANATLIADTGASAGSAGLEYDVTTGKVWMAAAAHLWSVSIDGSAEVADAGAFDYGLLSGPIVVDDIGSIPLCDP